jgi:hypothetical protein
MPALNLWPLLEQLSIRTKSAKVLALQRDAPFAWAQREFVSEVERQYNAGLPVRIIVLKGRQLGISTITEAILFLWAFLHPGSRSLVLSMEKDDSKYLMSMTKRYWEQGPFYGVFSTKYNNVEEIAWDAPIGSVMRVATASKEEVARGTTVQAAHCSEVARYGDQADTIIPGLQEAIPDLHGTIWIHESTAHGVGGYFYDEWMAASDPTRARSDFTAMFFPWWRHDEYEIPTHHLSYTELDDDEREVVEFLLAQDVEPSSVLAKIAWRRRRIAREPRGLEGFHEEYPCTPAEAFVSTGTNVFPLIDLATCYKPHVGSDRGFLFNNNGKLEFAHNATGGHLTVYRSPGKRQRYAVATDPTLTIEGDPACIQVINRATMEQCAVWHGHADPTTIGEIALGIAYWYNDALLNTEVNGGGRSTLEVWRRAGYRNIWLDRRPDRSRRSAAVLCWNTTYDTKQWLITTLQGMLTRHHVTIHHPATYHEMTQYTALENGTFGPARRSGHDDCVMAFGICVMTATTEWSSLDMNAVMGLGPGEPGIGDRKLAVANYGTPLAHFPGMAPPPVDLPVYALPSEVDEWV